MLVILDGWGLGRVPAADAIALANTPVFDWLMSKNPHATLTTFGEEVGLPDGQMGNSEVGHLNLGAGRVVYQSLAKINRAVRLGDLGRLPKLQEAIMFAKLHNRPLHLMGLVSDGGVHAHIDHLLRLIDIAAEAGLTKIYIHAFTDGRDVDPYSGAGFLRRVMAKEATTPARVATVTGRFYAMDRDNRWERVARAYHALVNGVGESTHDPAAAVEARYTQGQSDEFIEPLVRVDAAGKPIAKIADGDVVICFNFRTDRPREITEVLTQADHPEQGMRKLDLRYVTMTQYSENFRDVTVLFEPDDLGLTMGEIVSAAGRTQVRIAETEKYPHVTFFFSGGREEEFPGERRILIPSPREVETYDEKPEMSAYGVTDAIIQDIRENAPDFICLNYANTDMVGHTGVFAAAIRAAETVDECLGRLLTAAADYDTIILADHGNSDFMINEDGSPNTIHTMNPVPVIYAGPRRDELRLRAGKLGDVAPTLLWLMDIERPTQMTGEVLASLSK